MTVEEKDGTLPEFEFIEEKDGIKIVNVKSFYFMAVREAMAMTRQELLNEMEKLRREREKAAKRRDREIEAIFSAEIYGLADVYLHCDYVKGSI